MDNLECPISDVNIYYIKMFLYLLMSASLYCEGGANLNILIYKLYLNVINFLINTRNDVASEREF